MKPVLFENWILPKRQKINYRNVLIPNYVVSIGRSFSFTIFRKLGQVMINFQVLGQMFIIGYYVNLQVKFGYKNISLNRSLELEVLFIVVFTVGWIFLKITRENSCNVYNFELQNLIEA